MKKLSLVLVGLSLATSAFANQTFYVSCEETRIDPATGQATPLAGYNKWSKFELDENETVKKTSQLDSEYRYHISMAVASKGSVRLPADFEFQTLFGHWSGGSLASSKGKGFDFSQDAASKSKSSGTSQDGQTRATQEQVAPTSDLVGPLGLELTNSGDLNILPMFKPGWFKKSEIIVTKDKPVTALNWGQNIIGNAITRTVHVYQPQGSSYWVKLLCDKEVKR